MFQQKLQTLFLKSKLLLKKLLHKITNFKSNFILYFAFYTNSILEQNL